MNIQFRLPGDDDGDELADELSCSSFSASIFDTAF